ncbi:MAG: type II toxin-antitoxin system VapC family toxin [Pyrinomonadaceae bacterium]
MIVVDANVIIYLVLHGPNTSVAEKVAEKDGDWRSPIIWRSEVLNTLAGYLRRGEAREAILGFFRNAEDWIKADILIDVARVLTLVERSDCTAYDCEYVAAAESLRCPLITNDKQIIRNFPNVALTMSDFLGL